MLQTDIGSVDAVAFSIDLARLDRYAIRITKGLLAHHFPDYDYSDCSFESRVVPNREEEWKKLDGVRDLLRYAEKGEGVFRYRFGLTDTRKSGLWMLIFYDAILLLVFHSKGNGADSKA